MLIPFPGLLLAQGHLIYSLIGLKWLQAHPYYRHPSQPQPRDFQTRDIHSFFLKKLSLIFF